MKISKLRSKSQAVRVLWKGLSPLLIAALLASSIPVAVEVAFPTPVSAATTDNLLNTAESGWVKTGEATKWRYSGGFSWQDTLGFVDGPAWWGDGGIGGDGTIEQTVNTTAYSGDIEQNKVYAALSFDWGQGFGDELYVYLTFKPSVTSDYEFFRSERDDSNILVGTETNILGVPKGTTSIVVKVKGNGGGEYADFGIGDLKLTLSGITPSAGLENTGMTSFWYQIYEEKNQSAKDYNETKRATFLFKNNGEEGAPAVDWTASSDLGDKLDLAQTSGTLAAGKTQGILVRAHAGSVGDWGGKITITGTFKGSSGATQTVTLEIPGSVTARSLPSAPTLVSPALGSNGVVNVTENLKANFKVSQIANAAKYLFVTPDSTVTKTSSEATLSLTQLGDSDVYVRVVNADKVEGYDLPILVTVWKRPTVLGEPPAGNPSWRDGKYVGVKGQPITLQAQGETGTSGQGEFITKFYWDLDNDWDEPPDLTQTAGQSVDYPTSKANLAGRVRAKAETNYGIVSDERIFDLKVYDTVQVDSGGPYGGRPNKAIELKGSANAQSYPGAVVKYQWQVGGSNVKTDEQGRAEYTWPARGDYTATLTATVTIMEGLTLTGSASASVVIQAGQPTAMPGGPYQGGIKGGDFSPIQFSGNPPDFVEAEDVGKITEWQWFFADRSNKALKFDGVDDYVNLGNPSALRTTGSTSIMLWLKPGKLGKTQYAYVKSKTGEGAITVETDGKVTYYYGTCQVTTLSALEVNTWTHLAIVRDLSSGTLTWYKNGILDKQESACGAATASENTAYIGKGDGSVSYFLGSVDELAVWNRALSETEVVQHMTNGLKGTEKGIVGLWPFEDGQGVTAKDKSSSRNHGTLVNMDAKSWVDDGHPIYVQDVWNPAYAFPKAGQYEVALYVKSEGLKRSVRKTAAVQVIDGTIAGYVKAADLRTPVKDVRLTIASDHVDRGVLASIADADARLHKNDDGSVWTLTDEAGYYSFERLPLGSYRVLPYKKNADLHEFDPLHKVTQLTLKTPNQLAIDFVDLTVFPVGGRTVYSLKKNGVDVLVDGVSVEAFPIGSNSGIKSLPSASSLTAAGVNWSVPLFAGKYLILASRAGHDIRIKDGISGYDAGSGLVVIKDARSDVDFVDYTTRELTVFVVDSGGYPMPNREVVVSGLNGAAIGQSDADGKFVTTLNPGKYTVTVQGGMPRGERVIKPAEVELTPRDGEVTMVIPVKIELQISPTPNLLGNNGAATEFLKKLGLTEQQIKDLKDKLDGYMYYWPPEPLTHTYTIKATANGKPVERFDLLVTDEVSQMTADPPAPQDPRKSLGDSIEYAVTGGLPKMDRSSSVNPPLAAPKWVRFQATKDGYLNSELEEENVTVLGDVPVGTAAQLISVPNVNYLVLHDPPGDGSYAYLDDSMTIKGFVSNMAISINDKEVPVYPSPWTSERSIKDSCAVDLSTGACKPLADLGDKGLLGYKSPVGDWQFWPMALEELARGMVVNVSGLVPVLPLVVQALNMGVEYGLMNAYGIQYEISPNRRLETPSGDSLPDLMGPGKGDVYYGEGWTLGLQQKYRLGIQWNAAANKFDLATTDNWTYDILKRTNQYVYTVRDIEKVIEDLSAAIGHAFDVTQDVSTIAGALGGGTIPDNLKNTFKNKGAELSQGATVTTKTAGTVWVITDGAQKYTINKKSSGTPAVDKLIVYRGEKDDLTQLGKLEESKKTWEDLLKKNLAYTWQKYYMGTADKVLALEEKQQEEGLSADETAYLSKLRSVLAAIETAKGDAFAAFREAEGSALPEDDSKAFETLIFSAGPTFDYSRTIAGSSTFEISRSIAVDVAGKFGQEFEAKAEATFPVSFVRVAFGKTSAEVALITDTGLGRTWETGNVTEQSVGFVLNDDDVGDNISTRVYKDPVWGTPLFITDPGSVTSDPWEPGTNKAVDIEMELLTPPVETFDYREGAHYTVKVQYAGRRKLTSSGIGFSLSDSPPDNSGNLTVKFNGQPGPYAVELSKKTPMAVVVVSLYPPEKDWANSNETQYSATITVGEDEDGQIGREVVLTPRFADLKAPRAVISTPYEGQRISPVYFPSTSPFEILAVSEDADLKSIQLQVRSKRPDGVWEPWYNLSSMLWEDGGANPNVTVFNRMDRRPPRREFTFKWVDSTIRPFGEAEYALRAIAIDKATRPNTDMDPPSVVFRIDATKPSVLNTVPDYQAKDGERIYQSELSATFTDDMRAGDFTDRTFLVTDLLNNNAQVAGYVSYNPALRKTVFVPIVPFKANGFYRVVVKTDTEKADGTIDQGVHDLAGNPLDNTMMWTFRTRGLPSEPSWSIEVTATDGIVTDAKNVAGVEFGASDTEDEKDVREVGSLANRLRLSFLNRQGVAYDRDIRPADGRLSHHWSLAVKNAATSQEVTIFWQPSTYLVRTGREYQVLRLVELDSFGNVSNTIPLDPTRAELDLATGLYKPLVAYTYTPALGETARYFRLDVQKSELVVGDFKKGSSGWVFFSVPITPQVADPFVNLGDDIDPLKLYRYDTASSSFKVYPPDLGEVSLQPGRGYFTFLEKDSVVDIGGALNQADVTVELEAAGLHSIGNPFLLPVSIQDLKVNGMSFDQAVAQGLVSGTLYRWKLSVTPGLAADRDEALTTGTLQPWKGYWLETKTPNITLTMPVPQDASLLLDNEPPRSTVISANANSPTVTVKWSGEDDTSGVKWYDIQYKDGPRGAWTNWLAGTTSTSAVFPGGYGHTFYFRSRAQDYAGNWEDHREGNGDVSVTPTPDADANDDSSTGPTVTVTSPNGGDAWTIRSRAIIAWSSSGLKGLVRIELSRDGGQSWATIVSRTANDGTYTWTVRGPAASQALVRVSSTSTANASDTSDASFSISSAGLAGSPNPGAASNLSYNGSAATITVTSPNGGETWAIGSRATVTWSSFGLKGLVRIELSRDGGQSWATIVSRTRNYGRYTWSVRGPAASQALVRVSSASSAATHDVSDASFRISDPGAAASSNQGGANNVSYVGSAPAIEVTSPSGGETWATGSRATITWSSSDPKGLVRIELSRDGGQTWQTIVSRTRNDGEYTWRVRGPTTTDARIRTTHLSTRDSDTSDASFTIAG